VIEALRELFAPDVQLHAVAPSLWSTLGPGGTEERYDAIAASYDRLIGSRLYQRLAWGNDPANESDFAARAMARASGPLVDVGCGSLLFTAQAHQESGRPSLLLDLSLGMLRRGIERLESGGASVPPRLALVQADALSLPLRPGCFDTVLCPGILHLFEDPASLLRGLAALLAPGAGLYVSCLVSDRRFGRGYLRLLERSGEVKTVIDAGALRQLVERATGLAARCDIVGNMAYVHAERAS